MQERCNDKNSISIKAFSRLHLSLIGMSHLSYRLNGGIGFYINDPFIVIHASLSNSVSITDERKWPISQSERFRLINLIADLACDHHFQKVKFTITGQMHTHFGFGSGSSIRLACIEALYYLNNVDIARNELVNESLRGRTSGIGINTYFEGGLVVDAGIRNTHILSMKPSCANEVKLIPPALLISRYEMPLWEIGICIPNSIDRLSEDDEITFFDKTCPIPIEEVHAISYDVLLGILPAILEQNLKAFAETINNIQNRYWKLSERNLYGIHLQKIENTLRGLGALAVGMSSLGPSLFFLSNNADLLIKEATPLLPDCTFIRTNSRNTGRELANV